MNSYLHSFEDIQDRLLKLEKQNRRLKQLGATVLIIAASIFSMGQAAPKKTVEANEFLLKDVDGKVRGRLSMLAQNIGPQLSLLGEDGKELVNLTVIGNTPFFSLRDSNGKERITMSVQKGGPLIVLRNAKQQTQVMMALSDSEGWGTFAVSDSGGNTSGSLIGGDAGARLDLSDRQGFRATVGRTQLIAPRTGEIQLTSAASVVLFDKDKNVIWKAP